MSKKLIQNSGVTDNTKLGVVGFGLIGQQRLRAALDYGVRRENTVILDPREDLKSQFDEEGILFLTDSKNFFKNSFDRVIIGTPHNVTLELAKKSLDSGALVLIEKPMGINLEQANDLFLQQNSSRLNIGFNYRFMPGVIQLKKLIETNELGKLTSISMELGHGGSPQDFDSWKLNPDICGGGALLDPGIHLIDLLFYIFDLSLHDIRISGTTTWRGFWGTGIEESVSVVGYVNNTMLQINISLVWWRTKFKITVNGTDGYFEIDGRGRSDGPQRTIRGRRWSWLEGLSQSESENTETVANADKSIQSETHSWLENGSGVANAEDGLNSMKLYDVILRRIND